MLATGNGVADEIVFEVRIERRIDHVRRDDEKERIAVRRRPHDEFGGDVAAGARPILHNKRHAQLLRQRLRDQARINVGVPPGGETHDQTHRPRRIAFRPRDARE